MVCSIFRSTEYTMRKINDPIFNVNIVKTRRNRVRVRSTYLMSRFTSSQFPSEYSFSTFRLFYKEEIGLRSMFSKRTYLLESEFLWRSDRLNAVITSNGDDLFPNKIRSLSIMSQTCKKYVVNTDEICTYIY